MPEISCRHFNGYKPCGYSIDCSVNCPSREVPSERILIIHLEAIGAVLRSTALLPAIRRKYPNAHITWVTKSSARPLLEEHPSIDRILTIEPEDLLRLQALQFDLALVIDKSLTAGGILRLVKVKDVYGFRTISETGAVVPANPEAHELWHIGLSDQKKFHVNKKTEAQLSHEALALGPYHRDEYSVHLTYDERQLALQRRKKWSPTGQLIIGLNTGCSPTIPYKKLSIDYHRQLIQKLMRLSHIDLVLLGGKEDEPRNQLIAKDLPVSQSPTGLGVRDGLISVAACDIVVSGDSLGMHMAIALRKWVVAWFGPTCAHEIDLYDRGVKILTKAPCSPCWKRTCHQLPMCYDLVAVDELMAGIKEGIKWHTSSSKPHFLETFSSLSP